MNYDPETDGAIFSSCLRYRHLLWRKGYNPLVFVMLNPSIANAHENDHTLRSCLRIAKHNRFDGVVVANLHDLISTDAKVIKTHTNTTSILANHYIEEAAHIGSFVVCAWGNGGVIRRRGEYVRHMLRGMGVQMKCFNITKLDQPEHPLYQRTDVPLIDFP